MAQKFTLNLIAVSGEYKTDVYVEHLGSAHPISAAHRELIEDELRERVRQSASIVVPHTYHFIGAVGEIFTNLSGGRDAVLVMEWFSEVIDYALFAKRLEALV